MKSHNDLIKEQFNKQAATFGTMAGHYDALDLMVRLAQAHEKDTVLDVACGPGIVACAFAKKTAHVRGIDLVPAMIEKAKAAQEEQNLKNMSWEVGNVNPLPYAHCSYSIVVSRFAFHHFTDPLAVLKEMSRVVNWEGRVLVTDVYITSKEQSHLYDQMEKLRDPSHTRALMLGELTDMYKEADLTITDKQFYRLEVDVEELLKATLTPPKEAAEFKTIVKADIGINKIGIEAKLREEKLIFSFPVVIMVGQKQAPANYGLSACS